MGNGIEKNLGLKEQMEKEKKSIEKKRGREGHEIGAKSKLEQLKAEVVTNRERKEAETILTKFSSNQKEKIKNDGGSIENNIKKLNRPEAEKGLIQSYSTIENEIKNSKNEPGIAGFFGKIMNGILNS